MNKNHFGRFSRDGTKIATDIYYKPTDSKQYLFFNSCHPKHTKTSIPFSLADRIRSIVTTQLAFYVNLHRAVIGPSAWVSYKPVSCKIHTFLQMQLVPHCSTAVLYEPISKLYIYTKNQPYIFPMLGLRFFFSFFFFFFCTMDLRNLTNNHDGTKRKRDKLDANHLAHDLDEIDPMSVMSDS